LLLRLRPMRLLLHYKQLLCLLVYFLLRLLLRLRLLLPLLHFLLHCRHSVVYILHELCHLFDCSFLLRQKVQHLCRTLQL
jgi:hypothetical protein